MQKKYNVRNKYTNDGKRLYRTSEIAEMFDVTDKWVGKQLRESGIGANEHRPLATYELTIEQVMDLKRYVLRKLIKKYHLEDVALDINM